MRSETQAKAYEQAKAARQEALARTFEKLLDGNIITKAVFAGWYQQCLQKGKREALSAPVENFLRRRVLV